MPPFPLPYAGVDHSEIFHGHYAYARRVEREKYVFKLEIHLHTLCNRGCPFRFRINFGVTRAGKVGHGDHFHRDTWRGLSPSACSLEVAARRQVLARLELAAADMFTFDHLRSECLLWFTGNAGTLPPVGVDGRCGCCNFAMRDNWTSHINVYYSCVFNSFKIELIGMYKNNEHLINKSEMNSNSHFKFAEICLLIKISKPEFVQALCLKM